MSDYPTNSGLWFLAPGGRIAEGPFWGVPGFPAGTAEGVVRAAGWLPAVESGKEPDKDEAFYETVETGRAVAGDVVALTYRVTPRDVAAARAGALLRVNREAGDRFGRYNDSLLRKVRTGEELRPATAAALASIQATADGARAAIAAAATAGDVAAVFPVPWAV